MEGRRIGERDGRENDRREGWKEEGRDAKEVGRRAERESLGNRLSAIGIWIKSGKRWRKGGRGE